MEVISLECPNCGAGVTTKTVKCESCRKDIIIKSFSSMAAMPLPLVNKHIATYKKASVEHPDNNDINTSIGMCFLRLKKYDQALEAFEKAQADNFEDATPFYYAAVARLKGRKPFLCVREDIDQMETDLNAALSIDPQAVHYYFLSYIGRDYFNRKFFKHSPTSEELRIEALNAGLTVNDVEEFHSMIGTPIDISLD